MTGYGKGQYVCDDYDIIIEIKTVNHRYCDINIRGPRNILSLEDTIKKKIKEFIHRGRIEVFINICSKIKSGGNIKVNIELAKSYKKAIENLSTEINLYSDISMDKLLEVPDLIAFEEEKENLEIISKGVIISLEQALIELEEMRLKEGNNIRIDIMEKIKTIFNKLKNLEKYKENIVLEYKEKLEKRIVDILKDKSIIDSKIVAYS